LSRHFAILMPSPLAMPAAGAEDEESRLQAGLTGRTLSGPGLWLEWLEEIDRRGLAGELLAEGNYRSGGSHRAARPPAGPGAEREDDPAVRPGRVPVPRRGLRRDLTHHLRHAPPRTSSQAPRFPPAGRAPVDWARSGHARGSVRSADPSRCELAPRWSARVVCERRLNISALAAVCR
jgi:hypothetical protein